MVVAHSDMCLGTLPLIEGGGKPGAAAGKGPEGTENQVRKWQVTKAWAAGLGRRPDLRRLRGRTHGEISALGVVGAMLSTAWREESLRGTGFPGI